MDIGIDRFAAILPDPAKGRLPYATDRIAALLEGDEVTDRDAIAAEKQVRSESEKVRLKT